MQAHYDNVLQMILPPYLVFIGFSLSAGYVRTPYSEPGQVADTTLAVRPEESPLGPSQERTLLRPHAWEIVREYSPVPSAHHLTVPSAARCSLFPYFVEHLS